MSIIMFNNWLMIVIPRLNPRPWTQDLIRYYPIYRFKTCRLIVIDPEENVMSVVIWDHDPFLILILCPIPSDYLGYLWEFLRSHDSRQPLAASRGMKLFQLAILHFLSDHHL